ncbi:MAG: hypothetical protein ABR531_01230, partial [Bacteroidales bacterium]
MTEDKKAIRLSKAAREFNVGIQTIVEYLHKKGFDISPDPNGKIPSEAYALIVKEYSSDLSVKKDAEKLALKEKITPKKSLSIDDMEPGLEGDTGEPDEEILIMDNSGIKKHLDLRTEIRKPEVKTVSKVDLTPPAKTEKKEPETPVEEPVAAEPKADTAVPEKPAETKHPRVIGKVDLDKLKDKPGRSAKKQEAAKKEPQAEQSKPEPEAATPAPVAAEPVAPQAPQAPEAAPEPKESEIYRPGYEKLAGP